MAGVGVEVILEVTVYADCRNRAMKILNTKHIDPM